MKTEIKNITPEWASKILAEKNAGNRPINRVHVESLAKEMLRGKWKLNGDTICLNDERLIDGQHRLSAVALSGVTIQAFVIYGLSSDVFDTKDVGKKRSAGDTLGVIGEANASRMAAALVMVDKYMTSRADKSVVYSNTEIKELLQKYSGLRYCMNTAHKLRGLIQPSVLDACHYLFRQKDEKLADEFVEKITFGTDMSEGSPWYVLRERLMANSLAKAKLSKAYIMALCIKAWNHARNGTKVRCLRWREKGDAVEKFPIIS